MSNNLMNVNINNLPAHIRNMQATDEFGAGIGSGGLDMPVLSIRGKEFRFRYQGEETTTRSRSLECVLLRARPSVSKRFYEKAYSPGSVELPDCFSTDGVRPDSNVPNPQSDKCATCPHNQFGSKITDSGKPGKACSDYKRFVILPVMEGRLTSQPVVMDLSIMSLRKRRGDQREVMFAQEYAGALHRHGLPPYAVVTTLEFTDAEYPQVAMGMSRLLEEDESAEVLRLREDDLVHEALDGMEEPGPIEAASEQPVAQMTQPAPAQQAPQQAPAQQAAPQQVVQPAHQVPQQEEAIPFDNIPPVQAYEEAAQQQAAPQPQAAPQAAAQPAQQAPQQAPQQAAPAPAQEPADDDIMADVRKLLGGGA